MLFEPYEGDPARLPALTLAYLGDSVYELYIRRKILNGQGVKAHALHRQAISQVNASAQAKLLKKLEPSLTEDEWRVVRRGRNAKSGQVPKNAIVGEYRLATGLEALLGYLFLKGEWDRIDELLVNSEQEE